MKAFPAQLTNRSPVWVSSIRLTSQVVHAVDNGTCAGKAASRRAGVKGQIVQAAQARVFLGAQWCQWCFPPAQPTPAQPSVPESDLDVEEEDG